MNAIKLEQFTLYYADRVDEQRFCTSAELEKSGYARFFVCVPCELENELQKQGILPDLYVGDNVFQAQDYEYCHQWYVTRFDCDFKEPMLCFEGIDTISEIYVNGEFIGATDNAFLPYSFPLHGLKKTGNELVVHILPVMEEAQKYEVTAGNFAYIYNHASLHIRKVPSAYGWDIFPRVLGGGIWKDVILKEKDTSVFKELYLYTCGVKNDYSSADVCLYFNLSASDLRLNEYSMHVEGICRGEKFIFENRLWNTSGSYYFTVKNPRLWWPNGEGEQNLYEVTVTLLKQGKPIESKTFETGLRTVRLCRTPQAVPDGKFEFIVNNRKIFVMGMNWVPTDIFRTKAQSRVLPGVEMLKDLHCNMVRVWGGGYYESEAFYSLCDRNGILVWQDFMMACATYPVDATFEEKLRKEAEYIVKTLRIHPSIALWSGDNECDCAHQWGGFPRNPCEYTLTRKILPSVVYNHDPVRAFLASSPYMNEETHLSWNVSEFHQWAQEEFFKADVYKTMPFQFISETGYLALPSEKSLRTFLRDPDRLCAEGSERYTDEYIAHVTDMVRASKGKYCGRMKIIYTHVKQLFGKIPDNLSDLVKAAQISQAEALKYWIERMRIKREERGGIILWNLMDGYTQISDALADYYFRKKAAYYYVKRSQARLCMIFDEPSPDLDLYCVNEDGKDRIVEYIVDDLTQDRRVSSGTFCANARTSSKVDVITADCIKKTFYLIRWRYKDENGVMQEGKNHYYAGMPNIDLDQYLQEMKKAGFEDFE